MQRNLDTLELMWTAEDHTARRPSPQTSIGRALITFGGADAAARNGAAEWLKAMLQVRTSAVRLQVQIHMQTSRGQCISPLTSSSVAENEGERCDCESGRVTLPDQLKAMLQEALKQKTVSSRVDSADQASAGHLMVPGVVALMKCAGYRSKGSRWELAASSDEEVAAVHAALAAVAQDSDAELGLEAGASIDGLTMR